MAEDDTYNQRQNTANNEMIASEQKRALQIVMTIGAKLSRDGDQWCWLYGDNMMEGVVGFGKTPMCAAFNFERAFS